MKSNATDFFAVFRQREANGFTSANDSVFAVRLSVVVFDSAGLSSIVLRLKWQCSNANECESGEHTSFHAITPVVREGNTFGNSCPKKPATGLGFEPRMREPKSLVLPLHHPV